MTERQKEKLREVLKKYPRYDVNYGEDYLTVTKYGYVYMQYQWDKKIVREFRTINQILFNEIMEIIDE